MANNTQNNQKQKYQKRKKFKWLEWRTQDWIWLVLILSAIIYFVTTFRLADNVQVVDLFSFISSSVSIALAVAAIFYAWKQDSDNQVVTRDTSNLLSIITTKIEGMDTKIDKLDPRKFTEPVETQLKAEIEKIIDAKSIENNPQILKEINEVINKKFSVINNNFDNYYAKSENTRRCLIDFRGEVTYLQFSNFLGDLNNKILIKDVDINFNTETDISTISFMTDSYDLYDIIPELATKNSLELKRMTIG